MVRYSPILLKNSDLSAAKNFACSAIGIAHLRHDTIIEGFSQFVTFLSAPIASG
jgi:hypothetical protein